MGNDFTRWNSRTSCERRRSFRASIQTPVLITGTDFGGMSFQESVETTGVSRHGGRLITTTRMLRGEEIVITHPKLCRSATARVVAIYENRFLLDPFEVAVELCEPQDIWGVEPKPEGWPLDVDSPQAANASDPGLPSRMAGVPAPEVSGVPRVSMATAKQVKPPARRTSLVKRLSFLFPVDVRAFSTSKPKRSPEMMNRARPCTIPVNPGPKKQDTNESSGGLPVEPMSTPAGPKSQLNSQAGQLESLCSDLAEMLEKAQELRKALANELENAQAQIAQCVSETRESFALQINGKVEEAVREALPRLVNQAAKALEQKAVPMLHSSGTVGSNGSTSGANAQADLESLNSEANKIVQEHREAFHKTHLELRETHLREMTDDLLKTLDLQRANFLGQVESELDQRVRKVVAQFTREANEISRKAGEEVRAQAGPSIAAVAKCGVQAEKALYASVQDSLQLFNEQAAEHAEAIWGKLQANSEGLARKLRENPRQASTVARKNQSSAGPQGTAEGNPSLRWMDASARQVPAESKKSLEDRIYRRFMSGNAPETDAEPGTVPDEPSSD
jgi:putative lipoic acid-binding regulatory protein